MLFFHASRLLFRRNCCGWNIWAVVSCDFTPAEERKTESNYAAAKGHGALRELPGESLICCYCAVALKSVSAPPRLVEKNVQFDSALSEHLSAARAAANVGGQQQRGRRGGQGLGSSKGWSKAPPLPCAPRSKLRLPLKSAPQNERRIRAKLDERYTFALNFANQHNPRCLFWQGSADTGVASLDCLGLLLEKFQK